MASNGIYLSAVTPTDLVNASPTPQRPLRTSHFCFCFSLVLRTFLPVVGCGLLANSFAILAASELTFAALWHAYRLAGSP